MNPQSVSGLEEKQTLKDLVMPFALLAIIGATMSAITWGTWSIFGHVPKMLGISRLWLDTISGLLYLPIMALYASKVLYRYNTLSDEKEKGDPPVSFNEFARNFPWLIRLGIFLAVNFVASVFLSLAFGLAFMVILCCHQSWRRQIFSSIFEMTYRKSTEEIDEESIVS